jgi:hypothetical protein
MGRRNSAVTTQEKNVSCANEEDMRAKKCGVNDGSDVPGIAVVGFENGGQCQIHFDLATEVKCKLNSWTHHYEDH